MLVKCKSLPMLITMRRPSFLERLLLGITCMGFCIDNGQENIEHCRKFCWETAFQKLGYNKMLEK